MLNIQRNITTVNRYKGGNKKKWIVVHDVGALGQAYENTAYFKSVSRGSSCHYFVDTDSIWQSVEDNDRAWQVGDDKKNDNHDVGDQINNSNTIGIELCLNKNWKIESSTKKNGIDLIKFLQKKHNIPNSRVVRHFDASGKRCPGSMAANNWAEWKAFYAQIAGKTANIPTSNAASYKLTVYKVKAGDTLSEIAKQYNVTLSELKSYNGLTSDLILVGQQLKLVDNKTQTYKVIKGDTLWEISLKHATTVKALKDLNNLKSDVIQPGTLLRISGTVKPKPAAKPAAKPKPVATKPKAKEKWLKLPKTADSWRIYKVNGPYTAAHAIGKLNPKKFGGLEYKVLGTPMTDVVLIQTSNFGKVAVYVAGSTGATFFYK